MTHILIKYYSRLDAIEGRIGTLETPVEPEVHQVEEAPAEIAEEPAETVEEIPEKVEEDTVPDRKLGWKAAVLGGSGGTGKKRG